MPVSRVVVDASRLKHQRELISARKAAGAEIVLDTKAAELAAPMKARGYAKDAPWGRPGNGWLVGPDLYASGRADDIFGAMARFAVQHRLDAVPEPGHFIDDPLFGGWFDLDCQSCIQIRRALDREGGHRIAIDYLLIAKHTSLNDDDRPSGIAERLADLPFDNLWIRASGFGSDAGPARYERRSAPPRGNSGDPARSSHVACARPEPRGTLHQERSGRSGPSCAADQKS